MCKLTDSIDSIAVHSWFIANASGLLPILNLFFTFPLNNIENIELKQIFIDQFYQSIEEVPEDIIIKVAVDQRGSVKPRLAMAIPLHCNPPLGIV